MTWTFNKSTGELLGPGGQVQTTLSGPPYRLPDDAQKWAETEFRQISMSELTTDMLADYAELWVGNVEVVEGGGV
jgi:hypothetical protein